MIPTCQQVFDGIRARLGDTAVPGGTKYKNQLIRQEAFAPAAYRELYSALQGQNVGKITRTVFTVLPAYTAYLLPRTAGINSFGEVITIRQRKVESDLAITGVALGATYADITVPTHGRNSGEWVQVYGVQGISDDINDSWMANVQSSSVIRLNGCRASGTWTSNTGRITFSRQPFASLERASRLAQYARPSSTALSSYVWKDDAFRFIGSTIDIQLEITFLLSGAMPTRDNDSLGIDDCSNFLIYRTAGLLALQYAPKLADSLNALAIGGSQDIETEMGGFLGQLVGPQIRDKQKEAIHRPAYRPRRLRYGYAIIQTDKSGRAFDDSFDGSFG